MECIEIKVPITVARAVADCIEVGAEGAEHLDDKTHEDCLLVSGDIRIQLRQKVEAIVSAYKVVESAGLHAHK